MWDGKASRATQRPPRAQVLINKGAWKPASKRDYKRGKRRGKGRVGRGNRRGQPGITFGARVVVVEVVERDYYENCTTVKSHPGKIEETGMTHTGDRFIKASKRDYSEESKAVVAEGDMRLSRERVFARRRGFPL